MVRGSSVSFVLPNASLSVNDHVFQSDLKVFQLAAYDMIFGLDWLVKVHWHHKWMAIPYEGSFVLLHGL
jgi:hypothetical protein